MCKVTNCNKPMAIAGPPNDRKNGLCWEHAVAFGDALAKTTPEVLLVANGIHPLGQGSLASQMTMPVNEDIAKHLGGMILSRLGGL